MMLRGWFTSIALVAVLVVSLVVLLAGCGSQKRTIPTAKAQSFLQQLDTISSQFDNGACVGAGAKVRALESQVRALPSSVDAEVKRNLVAGVARLETLVSRQCQRPTPTNTTPTVPTPTVPTATVPTTPNTVPTTPTTPNTTPTTPNTTPTTPPPTNTTPGGGGGVTVPGTTIGGGTP
jgi:outer membrane murein-binding lipoprotein Lpp